MSGSHRKRRNWIRSLTVVTIIAGAGAVLSGFFPNEPAATNRLYLQSSAGAVLFDHSKHSSNAESCAVCHHELYSAEPVTACIECHDEGFSADDVSHERLKEIHSRDCSTCHEQNSDNVEPISCRECHPGAQQSEPDSISCTECHDDDYSPEIMEHDEYLEIEDHTCLGCHSPGTISEVFHLNCSNCHLETAPDRFATDSGEVSCGACHLR